MPGGKDASFINHYHLQNIRYLRIYTLLNVVFIETRAFTNRRQRYLSEDGYLRFQQLFIQHPESGALIMGTGRRVKFPGRMCAEVKASGVVCALSTTGGGPVQKSGS